MRIVGSADWRDAIPFDTPTVVADAAPGEPTRCSTCGGESELRDRSELWLVKHRHPKQHAGFVRFYCRDHVPVITRRPESVAPVVKARAERRPPVKRPTAVTDRVRAMCPNCFVEVAADGTCGMCGESAA